MRHASWFNHQPAVYTSTTAAKLMASTLTKVLSDGFQFNLPTNTTLRQESNGKISINIFLFVLLGKKFEFQ